MTGFFDLPIEVRHMIYMNLISVETPLDFWQPFPRQTLPRGWLHIDLFYTSRMISLDYRAWLYSTIPFDLTTHSPAQTAKFLDQIGENANFIRRVHIRFLKVLENGDGLFISEQSAQILDTIQNACTGLTKVTFGPVYAFEGSVSPYLENPEKISNLFSLVNDRLEAFPSLWSITVEIPGTDAYRHIRDELKNDYGWNVIEEEDWIEDGWYPRRINRSDSGQGYNGRSGQYLSGVLAGIGAPNQPRLQNNIEGEMDEDSSGSSDDTREDGHDRNTGGFDSGSDDESIQDDSSSNTTVNTENTGDGIDDDGPDEGFGETENPELYAYYQLGRLR